MTSLPDDLLRPTAYEPPLPAHVTLRETHASWVLLTERDVFKVKKPVDFGFLDFSTLARRQAACEAEVRLNARLARSVYFGVVPVRRGEDGRCRVTGDGPVVDWAVHMLRLPDDARADVRLARGTFGARQVDDLAATLVRFHARCRSDAATAAFGAPAAVEGNVRDNFDRTDAIVTRFVSPADADALRRWQLDFLTTHRARFERRAAEGRVREGHGDLRLEHVYVDPVENGGEAFTILDCIEFSEALRIGDVASDIAFLSMDLASRGHVDLAERLVARYATAADDFDLYGVVDFYESYRAHVRAKVATILFENAADSASRDAAAAEARRHLELALAPARSSLLSPSVVAVGGLIASGKSTVADAIADRLSAPVVSADRTRKAMLGVAHVATLSSAAFGGAYTPEFTEQVYDTMTRRAEDVLRSGRPVVLDASFRTAHLREKAALLARRLGHPFLYVECQAPRPIITQRLEERERRAALEGGSVSDGRLAILGDFEARSEAASEIPEGEHLVVDTTQPVATTLARLGERLATWPRGL